MCVGVFRFCFVFLVGIGYCGWEKCRQYFWSWACLRSGTGIFGVRFKKGSARRKRANCRAKMALRRMGRMPMLREEGFSQHGLRIESV